ncbi:MAG TPA: hypothetical protein VNE62_07485 [Actinomycetota bacterium]|nr:hypothetical protein [Actinomycetota bacterium]
MALDSPVLALDRPFDYRIPDRMTGRVRPGCVVRVPLHGRRVRAFVTELLESPEVPDPKPLSSLVSEQPVFAPPEIELARWQARRYVATLGQVLHQAVPGRLSAPALTADPKAPAPATPEADPGLQWLEEPGAMARAVGERGRLVVVAAGGAVEAEVVRAAVRSGGRTLVIAPRAAMVESIAASLPGCAVIHGDQKPADRARSWARARDGDAEVVVGGRAALLVPMPGLTTVVVAACHDRSLKEERTPRYHGLVVAARRAQQQAAAFVAVSPAPPLELQGDWSWPRRRPAAVRPEVAGMRSGPVTPRLQEVVRSAISRGSDALVFAGRRGIALRLRCRDCGWYPRCAACAVALTVVTAGSGDLRCRSCGTDSPAPSACGECGGLRLDGRGWGSDRVADELEQSDPGAPVLRVHAQSPLPRRRPSPAVIVGTAAAVWALYGRTVGAACVADLDQMLGRPDFRAGERALALLEEMASLLEPQGRFLVQTREPEHHAVQAFTRRSYRYFADRELPHRTAAGYPPYCALVHVEADPSELAGLPALLGTAASQVVGPLPRPGGRAGSLVRAPDVEPLLGPLREFARLHPGARIDVDPVDVL